MESSILTVAGITLIQPTGKMAHGKYYRDGAYYYYDTATGIMQYGEQTIDGDEYYFDTDTGAMVTGEVERDGRYYYYDDETGAMLGLGEQIVRYAEKFLGTPYTWEVHHQIPDLTVRDLHSTYTVILE